MKGEVLSGILNHGGYVSALVANTTPLPTHPLKHCILEVEKQMHQLSRRHAKRLHTRPGMTSLYSESHSSSPSLTTISNSSLDRKRHCYETEQGDMTLDQGLRHKRLLRNPIRAIANMIG